MERKTCRVCGSDDLEFLLDLGPQPLAGGFLKPDAATIEQEKQFPLPIHICRQCGLVQTMHVVPAEVLFTDYCFSASTISTLVSHFKEYAQWLKSNYNPNFVVEFGSNDGILQVPLEKLGIKTCGIDISKNITQMARDKGLNVITGFFNETAADEILERFGKADIVTGSNAFPHNDDPAPILKAARKVLQPNGHLCLEVMYAGDLLTGLQWDSMYHEHLSYYCLHTLENLLNRYGFHTVETVHLPMHAGSLRVVAAVNAKEQPNPSVKEMLDYEKSLGLTTLDTWRTFSQTVMRKINVVKEVLGNLSASNRIWGYGAAGRATMWVNACKMDYLEAIVDSSPLRSGRLMPGTHTPIVYPEALRQDPPDYIFVTAWNYAQTICTKEQWFKGIWVVPLPDLKFF